MADRGQDRVVAGSVRQDAYRYRQIGWITKVAIDSSHVQELHVFKSQIEEASRL